MASKCGSGGRLLSKLHSCLESGDYYQAHQLYRTLYYRYSQQKKYPEIMDLLYEGAISLFRYNQNTSGADLAGLLVETLITADASCTEDIFDKLATLYSLMDCDIPERQSFLFKALKWSSHGALNSNPKLHEKVGSVLWKEKNYSQSLYHYIRSTDGVSCAALLIEYHSTRGYPGEADLFIAQTVFQYLCLRNAETANVVFVQYTERHPSISGKPPFLLPLLNFLWFLLLIVESGKVTAFSVLCEKYRESINRDPLYVQYLDRIGQVFFGVPSPKRSMNPLDSFLNSLLSDENGGTSSEVSPNTFQTEDLD